MASDLGGTPIVVEFVRNTSITYTGNANPLTRSIWVRGAPAFSAIALTVAKYVRYIDWVVTTPLLLLTLLLGTGLPLSSIFFTIFMDGKPLPLLLSGDLS
jgi:bacteriorhodopsin